MSTYYNEARKRYENFEAAVVRKLESVAGKLADEAAGQITVVAGVRYDTNEQNLTETEKANARTNIGAAAVTVSGTTLTITQEGN